MRRLILLVVALVTIASAQIVYADTLYLPVIYLVRGVLGPGPDPAQVGKALYAPTLKAMPPPSFDEVKAFIDRTGKGEYSTDIVSKDGISVTVQHAGLDIDRMSKAELSSLRLYLPETQAQSQESNGARLTLCPPGHPAWIQLIVFGRSGVLFNLIVYTGPTEHNIDFIWPTKVGLNVFWFPAVDTPRAEISTILWSTGNVFAVDVGGGCFWVN